MALMLAMSHRASADDEIDVTVSGSPVGRHSSRDAAAASTVLRREDLASPGADAGHELTRVPGVQVQRSGGGSDLATASIRGTTSAQTPVYLAGIRLNDDISGTADLSTVPLWMLDRIEVYRGHSPFGLESNGIGGAILFEPRLAPGLLLRSGLTAGSWGQRSIYGAVGVGSKRSSALFAVRRESSDNDYPYLDNAGTAYTTTDDRWLTRRNAQQTTTDAWAIARVNASHSTQWTLVTNVFERSQGITGLLSVPAERTHANVSRELLGLSSRTSFHCGLREACYVTSATSLLRAGVSLYDPAQELSLGSFRLDSRSKRINQRFEIHWPIADVFEFGTLLGGSTETLEITRPSIVSLDATRHSGTLGIGPDLRIFPGVRLLGIAQLEAENTHASTQPTSSVQPIARLGASVEPISGLTFVANAGLYARVPVLGELYGTSAFVVGNSALNAERGTNRDLGIRYNAHSRAVSSMLELFVFRQDIDNLVAWQRSSFGQIKPYNVGTARLQGIEASGALEVWNLLHLEAVTTALDPRDVTPNRTQKNDIIPFRSRLVVDSTVEIHTRNA